MHRCIRLILVLLALVCGSGCFSSTRSIAPDPVAPVSGAVKTIVLEETNWLDSKKLPVTRIGGEEWRVVRIRKNPLLSHESESSFFFFDNWKSKRVASFVMEHARGVFPPLKVSIREVATDTRIGSGRFKDDEPEMTAKIELAPPWTLSMEGREGELAGPSWSLAVSGEGEGHRSSRCTISHEGVPLLVVDTGSVAKIHHMAALPSDPNLRRALHAAAFALLLRKLSDRARSSGC